MTTSDNLLFNSETQNFYQITDTDHSSWSDAVTEANELGGYLSIIDDAAELSYLQENINSDSQYWIGADDNLTA